MTPQDVEQTATKVYQKLGSRFGVNQTPDHHHDGIGSTKLEPTSLTNTSTLSSQSGGPLSSNAPVNSVSVVFPVPVVNAKPSGAAPVGTLVYNQGISFTGLYIYLTATGWTII